MQVKASLHLHTNEDTKDGPMIGYSIFELIDKAKAFNFGVLAITGHESCICKQQHVDYGKSKGILVIPGIELKISGKHILVINCDQSIETLKTLEDLVEYKNTHSEILVIAPHPNHGANVCLGLKGLRKFRQLFDAVEHSWYYSASTNPNKRVAVVCQELGLPLIATSDMHDLVYLNRDYAVLELPDLSVTAVKAAIRAGRFSNVTEPKGSFEMFWYQIKMMYRNFRSLFRLKK